MNLTDNTLGPLCSGDIGDSQSACLTVVTRDGIAHRDVVAGEIHVRTEVRDLIENQLMNEASVGGEEDPVDDGLLTDEESDTIKSKHAEIRSLDEQIVELEDLAKREVVATEARKAFEADLKSKEASR